MLAPWRDDDFSVVEIGIGVNGDLGFSPAAQGVNAEGGASLKMWQEFFTRAQIWGLDINKATHLETERIKTYQINQDSREQLEAFAAQARAGTPPRIRCVLDDGSHASVHQQLTMGVFFPLLEPGGVYILEDLHYQCFHREEGDANQGYELEEDTKTVDVLQAKQPRLTPRLAQILSKILHRICSCRPG